ncbi:Zn-dependent hydrolase [Taklimakanibacter albus]|uniref:Zn-dependent hydrolase n=1 Tax=Taklimakanibacter albus TaxID=2800327 RepID=A0ACC5RAZ0_9HYPH|nr:Zn-dependent hydrolase [Aestuariivirga sp. YIM B02566]MBK1869817.1 Zn-dependent hydrolase [Aestuariivirga sp. YIM B02566]
MTVIEETDFAELFADLDRLAGFGGSEGGGVSRTAFSPSFTDAQAWLAGRMAEAGLAVRLDAAGNLIGRFGPPGPAIVCGSHIDSVPNGGRFDGALGVLAGLAAFRALKTEGHVFDRALEVIAFADEEGEYFSLFGSRAMLGLVTAPEIEAARGTRGKLLIDALRDAGLDPALVASARRPASDFHAYVELHIEQGPVLEQSGFDLGVVENIVGIATLEVTFTGRPDHSGTTPMRQRKDAMRAAITYCQLCYDEAAKDEALRLNFDDWSAAPRALNVVAERVRFRQEIRHPDAASLSAFVAKAARFAQGAAEESSATADLRELARDEPAQMNMVIKALLKAQAEARGYKTLVMPSGAGHDAQLFAPICPTGMLFVPSVDGRSHCPQEFSKPDAIRLAVTVLRDALRSLTRI